MVAYMKIILTVLFLATLAHAQEWRPIKEMSGPIPDNPGLIMQVSVAQIARGEDRIKLSVKAEFPYGAPRDVFKDNVPWGFDPTSISQIVGRLDFNCSTLVVKPIKGSTEVYRFNGEHFKSKEPPFSIVPTHIFSEYFCERPK
jgi:hypothetical protein